MRAEQPRGVAHDRHLLSGQGPAATRTCDKPEAAWNTSLTGIEAEDKALALNPDYFEALTYKNILLRMQANLEKDPAKQKQLISEADDLQNKAMESRRSRQARRRAETPGKKGKSKVASASGGAWVRLALDSAGMTKH